MLPVVPDAGTERLLEMRLMVLGTEQAAPALGDDAHVPFVQRYVAEPVVGAVLSIAIPLEPLFVFACVIPMQVFAPTVHNNPVPAEQASGQVAVEHGVLPHWVAPFAYGHAVPLPDAGVVMVYVCCTVPV